MTAEKVSKQFDIEYNKLSQNPFYKRIMQEFWNRKDIKESLRKAVERIINKYYESAV